MQDPINGFDLDGRCWSGFGSVCHFYKKHKKLLRRGLELGVGIAFTAFVCAGTAGVGCIIAAGAVYGATASGTNYAFDNARHFKQGDFLKATVKGGLKGGLLPAGLGYATRGYATGFGQVAKRIFRFTFHRSMRWGDD